MKTCNGDEQKYQIIHQLDFRTHTLCMDILEYFKRSQYSPKHIDKSQTVAYPNQHSPTDFNVYFTHSHDFSMVA